MNQEISVKKSKLLLVNPRFKGSIPIPSFGLGFIATHVKKNSDWDVEVIEQSMQDISDADLLEKVKDTNILGLVCYTESRLEVFDFAKKAKALNPECTIIVGGAHVQTLDVKVLEHYKFIDLIAKGEGETTVLELVKGLPLDKIPGITWRNGDTIVQNPQRTFIDDVDTLDYDYELIMHQIEGWKDVEVPAEILKLKALPVIASRGCPFKCKFCAANRQWEDTYRYLSPEELLKRIKFWVEEYGIGYFRFYDALFVGTEARIMKFCDLLEESGLKISFRVDVRVGTSKAALKRLREVGCDVLGFGIESGSDKILKRSNKGITRKMIEETMALCRKLDYWIIGFFMVSLPDETSEDVVTSFELLGAFDEVDVQFFKIHPNTAFYDELVDNGEISDDVWFDPTNDSEFFFCSEGFKSAVMSSEEVYSHLSYAYNYISLRNPAKTMHTYGFARGLVKLLTAAVAHVLLSSSSGKKVHRTIKKSAMMKALYRWLTSQQQNT
jgi:anaerobic magnesium-protoporphyrin IX monomethyl ester cyclase